MYKIQESGLDKKWSSVLDNQKYAPIKDQYRRDVTAVILENQEKAFAESREAISMLQEAAPANAMGSAADTGGVAKWDSVLIGLVRRSMPQLIAYDICGVQPMTMPTQLIFAMKSKYSTQGGTEALFNEANSAFSGGGAQYGTNPVAPLQLTGTVTIGTGANTIAGSGTTFLSQLAVGTAIYTTGGVFVGTVATVTNDTTATLTANGAAAISGAAALAYGYGASVSTATGEALGTGSPNADIAQMAFSIEKTTVTAETRALKSEYTLELAQDLRAVHGLDAESELSNILSTEIMAEINRQVLRTIYTTSKWGAQSGAVNTAGTFDLDLDSNGRWSVEKFKGLMFQIERDANVIAQQTRRGRGNFIICSADVASALAMTGKLDYNPALNNELNVDEANVTFAGILNGKYKVYVDPFSANTSAADQFYVVGYRGGSAYDAGLFYAPYVPLQMVRAVDPGSFQPKIGFKTRYGMVANPFATGSNAIVTSGVGQANANVYYNKVKVQNLM